LRRGRDRKGKRKGQEEEKRVVEKRLEEPKGARDSRSLIEALARIIAH